MTEINLRSMFIDREIEQIICSCGARVKRVDTTDDEKEAFGCFRDREGLFDCCVKAFQCPGCNTRWTFALASPDAS